MEANGAKREAKTGSFPEITRRASEVLNLRWQTNLATNQTSPKFVILVLTQVNSIFFLLTCCNCKVTRER